MYGHLESIYDTVSDITRIPIPVLTSSQSVFDCSVAQRFSWAAKRKTTRIEDIAYSLIGLFNVNMPLLYGEGEKAFVRLQEEILRESSDQTIFAWQDSDRAELDVQEVFETPRVLNLRGVLATHPKFFKYSAGLRSKPMGYRETLDQREIASTNLGLRLTLPIHNCSWFIAAELAVTAVSLRDGQSRSHVSWALPENHIYIILWPEPGDKGRLMRVSPAPVVLKSQLPTLIKHSLTSSTLMLKSNWSGRFYRRRQFLMHFETHVRDPIPIGNCMYIPFPVQPTSLFSATGSASTWTFWEANVPSETVFLIPLHLNRRKLKPMFNPFTTTLTTLEAPGYTLLVWMHPKIGGRCAMIHELLSPEEIMAEKQYAILHALGTELRDRLIVNVPGYGTLSFFCTRTGIDDPAILNISFK